MNYAGVVEQKLKHKQRYLAVLVLLKKGQRLIFNTSNENASFTPPMCLLLFFRHKYFPLNPRYRTRYQIVGELAVQLIGAAHRNLIKSLHIYEDHRNTTLTSGGSIIPSVSSCFLRFIYGQTSISPRGIVARQADSARLGTTTDDRRYPQFLNVRSIKRASDVYVLVLLANHSVI